jgi:FkbM family methyltransferase
MRSSYRMPSFRKARESLGLINAIRFFIQKWRFQESDHVSVFHLFAKDADSRLAARPHTSDIKVFDGIFLRSEYRCISDLKNVSFVIDCGANVGYSSVFFLSLFKNCHVASVEPDPGNFDLLRLNLDSYSGRTTLYHAGVWSHNATLRIREIPYRDGDKWTCQVEECDVNSPESFSAIDIRSILRNSGYDRISLLKMDIEGAEAIVFSDGCEDWLSKVDNIVIELHDDSIFGPATDSVTRRIMSTNRFEQFKSSGETFVFRSKHLGEDRNTK